MRKITYIYFVFIFLSLPVVAQKPLYNHNLVFGHSGNAGMISFNPEKDSISYISFGDALTTNLSNTTISMSDSQGDLAFYSEGCHIYDAQHRVVPGSEKLKIADEDLWHLWCESQDYRIHMKNMIAIPFMETGYENYYHLIHYKSRNTLRRIVKDSIFHTVLKLENGVLKFVSMNNFVDFGDFSSTTTEFIRASDQESWWMIQSIVEKDTINIYKINHEGVTLTREQPIGNFSEVSWFNERYHRSAVSPDGTQYVRSMYTELLNYYYPRSEYFIFDREKGIFTEYLSYYSTFNQLPSTFVSMAFSADSKVFYNFRGLNLSRTTLLADTLYENIYSMAYYIPRDDVSYIYSYPSYAVVRGPDCRFYMPSFIPDNKMLILEEEFPRVYEDSSPQRFFPPFVNDFDNIYALPFEHNYQAPYMPEIYTGTIYEGECEEYEIGMETIAPWSGVRSGTHIHEVHPPIRTE